MINNDILRRLRFVFDYQNAKMIKIFSKVNHEMSQDILLDMLKKETQEGYKPCNDKTLCLFLDGLIIEKRGLKQDAAIPTPLLQVDNNLIFKKLRVALKMREEDIINTLALADFDMGKSELGALFRKPGHRHFKACGDQVLRNFLTGLSIKYRDK